MSILSSLSDTGGRSPVDAWVVNLAGLRDEGFRRVWMTQMPYEPDLLTALGIVLREVDTLEVATGVVPIQVQHPMQLAQRALTLSLIGNGRFILGVGMSHRVVTEQMWGISFDKPMRRMREYLDGLLPLLAGEPADAVGETVSTRGALQIPGAPTPDVYIAAMGPQMLRLAGRRSAGTVTWMTGPKTLAEHVGPTLREAAAEAGRADGAVRVVATLPVSVTDDAARAGAGRRAVRDVRPSAVVSRDAGPRGVRRTRGRRDHRRRADRGESPRRTERVRCRRVRRRGLRRFRRGPSPHARVAARA